MLTPRLLLIAALSASVTCLVPSAFAQNAPPLKTVIETATALNGQQIHYPAAQDGQAVISSIVVTMQPGEKGPLHSQEVPVFAYVLQGKVAYVDADGKPTEFAPGQAFVDPVNIPHSLETVGTEPARILVVFLGARNLRNFVAAK